MLDYSLEVSKFKLQSHYYIYSLTLARSAIPIPPVIGQIASLLFYNDGFGI